MQIDKLYAIKTHVSLRNEFMLNLITTVGTSLKPWKRNRVFLGFGGEDQQVRINEIIDIMINAKNER